MSDLSQLYSDKNIGDILKNRREELGVSLDEASQRLRIRLIFLKALEEGRIDQLPGVAYAAGFLKAYAELLKLDSDALAKRFRQENQANAEKPKLMFPAPVPKSGIPAGVIVLISFIIMVGAYIGWYKMSDHHQIPSEMIPLPPAQSDQNAGVSQQISPQIASIMPSDHPAPLPEGNKDANSGAAPALPSEAVQPPTPSLAQPQPEVAQPTFPPQDNNVTPSVEPKAPEQPVVIKAIAPSWIQIKDKEGKVLYQKVLKKDETWQVPSDKDEIIMNIGNPGVIVLEKGDIQSSPLGRKGRTLRRFVLNKEKATKLLHSTDEDTHPTSKASDDEASFQAKPKKKPVVTKPTSSHDSSADALNARQLKR